MPHSRKNILIVEDEPQVGEFIHTALEPLEADFTLATNASEALEVVRRKPVDLVITDFKMPGMDGISFLQAAKHACDSTNIIMMSAYGTVDLAVEAGARYVKNASSGAVGTAEPGDIRFLRERLQK